MLFILTALYIYQNKASFLQCSPSDSLESLNDLQEAEGAQKQGILCQEWPFYSGGLVKHNSGSSSDSSSEEEHHSPHHSSSLLPDSVTSDSILYAFDDSVETHQCLVFTDNYCNTWVSTKKEYFNKRGCERDTSNTLITEYKLCLCAVNNYGESSNEGTFCSVWACLYTPQYPSNYADYSLINDNDMISDGDSDHGDYYRFAQNGVDMQLGESMELSNCWCKASSLNGEYCLNWYCESLEHDEYGEYFVNYGWFACYQVDGSLLSSCNAWYGFLLNDADREEYRCECVDEECISWICGLKEIELRRNYKWYNFWIALIVWSCVCGCCGTKICFRNKRFNDSKYFKCRKCRMFVFYVLIGIIVMIHGGVPAFLFFVMISICSLYCAIKCENCKCCRSKCSMGNKWKDMKNKCDMKCAKDTNDATDTVITTNLKDGEKSKEDSESYQVIKSGHIAVSSVDLDEVDADGDDINV